MLLAFVLLKSSGVLEWEGIGAISDDFTSGLATTLPSCCSPAMHESSHRAPHGLSESCAGGRICPRKPENTRGIVGGFHSSRTGSEFRFLITPYTTTASCCSWNGICTGSERTDGRVRNFPQPVF